MPLSAHEILFQDKDPRLYSGLSRLSRVVTVDELLGAFRLAVASATSPNCIRKNTDPLAMSEQNLIIFGQDQEGSRLLRGVPLDQLVKHVFVNGVPGSGKTTLTLNLCLQLHQYGIPFSVIEPVRTEYRILKTFRNHPDPNARDLAEKLEVYTPGDDTVSPLRFNPLELLPGVSVYEHIDNILSCFKGAIPMEGSLPALLGEGLEQVYEDHPDKDHPPVMADLVAAAERVLARKGYSPDRNSDFLAVIRGRPGVLTRRSAGMIFQCPHSVPQIDHLIQTPTIIEFDRLHEEQTCLSILFLLTGIREYLKTAPRGKKKLRYAIIIEEAHNIVGRSGPAVASPDVANPKAFAAEYIVRMLAELRALGIAIIIVDQLPSAVAPEVIKNTTTKTTLRQPAKEDREVIGASMLLSPTQIEDLVRMGTGGAFLFTEGYYNSRRIQTINLHEKFDFSIPIENEQIIPYIKDDEWYQEAALERITDELALLQEKMDLFHGEVVQFAGELHQILLKHKKTLELPRSNDRTKRLEGEKTKAHKLELRLTDAYESFMRDTYRKYLDPESEFELEDRQILKMKDDIVNRFESIIRPDVEKDLDIINNLISSCNINES